MKNLTRTMCRPQSRVKRKVYAISALLFSALYSLLCQTALANSVSSGEGLIVNLSDEFEPLDVAVPPYNLPRRVKHRATGMILILVPGGTFTMGTPGGERGRDGDEVQRPGTIDYPFYMGEAEVTVGEWNAIMQTDSNGDNDNMPASAISWWQANEFLDQLNQSGAGGWRLPTETEWEFACRAGTTSPFSTGENITSEQANFNGSRPYLGEPSIDRQSPVEVRSFGPNPWGFYDMHGNVWEWCSDFYVSHPERGKTARGAPGDPRNMRGGAFTSRGKQLRCGYRDGYPPSSDGPKYGLRVAKTLKPDNS